MQDISNHEAKINYGIETKHTIMDNNEKRFRLVSSKDKTSYIRTESEDTGYWQNSHYHTTIREAYIVQKGKILFATYINNKVEVKELYPNDICVTEPDVPHNVYMYPETVVHTVKYGDIKDADWIEFKELDDILEKM